MNNAATITSQLETLSKKANSALARITHGGEFRRTAITTLHQMAETLEAHPRVPQAASWRQLIDTWLDEATKEERRHIQAVTDGKITIVFELWNEETIAISNPGQEMPTFVARELGAKTLAARLEMGWTRI